MTDTSIPGTKEGAALKLHHAAIATRDSAVSTEFYARALGLSVHPTKPNWLLVGEHGAVHLLEVPAPAIAGGPAHLAFQVETLEDSHRRLLNAGAKPFQLSLDYDRREISSPDVDLDWGIGTIFVNDPDGNMVELIQAGRGIFAEHHRDDLDAAGADEAA